MNCDGSGGCSSYRIEPDPLDLEAGARAACASVSSSPAKFHGRLQAAQGRAAKRASLDTAITAAPTRRRCPRRRTAASIWPPGRSAANRHAKRRSWSGTQWKVALENTRRPARRARARRGRRRSARAADRRRARRGPARSSTATRRPRSRARRECGRARAASSCPLPQPASSTVSSPARSSRSSTLRPHASCIPAMR